LSTISIKIDYAKVLNNDLSQRRYRVVNMKEGMSHLSYSVDYRIKSSRNINSRLNNAINEIDSIEAKLNRIKALIDYSTDKYMLADKYLAQISNFDLNSSFSPNSKFDPRVNANEAETAGILELFFKNKLKADDSYKSGESKIEGDIFGINAMAGASGKLLGYEASLKNSMGFDLKNGEFGISSKGELSGYVAKGEVQGQFGLLSGSAEITAVTGAVSGEAKAVLFENGVFNPELVLKAGAEAAGLKGNIKTQFGTDDFNVHGEAEGYVGVAKAEAELAISKNGAAVSAEAGAAVFKGEVKSGFEIFGISVDLSAEGEALAVGAKFEAGVDEDSIELGGKLSFLAGLGGKIKISW
jgi:hypothetical protein